MEDEDLYRFNRDVERLLGIEITMVCDGRTPWEVFRDERMIGNTGADMCSRILKRELLRKRIFENYQPDNSVIIFGMDWTEAERLERMGRYYAPFQVLAPMMDKPIWDKCQMLDELKKIGIKLPSLYADNFPHNNCGGFCIKAGQAHFAHLLKTRPETYAYHEEQEEQMRVLLGKDVAILRDRRGGTTQPMPLKLFRERVAAGEYDFHDWGGCGCALL